MIDDSKTHLKVGRSADCLDLQTLLDLDLFQHHRAEKELLEDDHVLLSEILHDQVLHEEALKKISK